MLNACRSGWPRHNMLLTEEPHVVAPKGTKSQKGKLSAQTWETFVTRFEETHTSTAHDGDVEDLPPPKMKRVASEDVGTGMHRKGSKRPRRTSARAADKLPKRVELSGHLEEDLLAMGTNKSTPRG